MRVVRLAPVIALVLGCGLINFDVEQAIPEQTVPGSPLAALLPPALFTVPLQVDLASSIKAHGTGPATAATLKSLTLTITAPPGETFSFLDSIAITIASPGMPEREIARLSPVPAEATIALAPAPNVNLLPYIESGTTTITAAAVGRAPARDIKFDGRVVITIKI
jgi:hypothetical protein